MALLGVDLEKEIYKHPPQGYGCLLRNGSSFNCPRLRKTSQKIVHHFRKFLHCVTQSSNDSYATFKDFVIWIGFTETRVDGRLFVLKQIEDLHPVVAAVILYVDGALIIVNKHLDEPIKYQMKKRFQMQDSRSVSFSLGMNMERNPEHLTINIHQHNFTAGSPTKKAAIWQYTNRWLEALCMR